MSMKRKVVALRWIIKSICEHNKAAWLTLLTRHVERVREIGQARDHNHTLPIMCETVRCRHDVGHAFSHCFRPRGKFQSFGREENKPKHVTPAKAHADRRNFFFFSKANRAIRKVSCQFVSRILCHELQAHLQCYNMNSRKIRRLRSISVIIYLKCVLLLPESYRWSEFFRVFRVLSAINGTYRTNYSNI